MNSDTPRTDEVFGPEMSGWAQEDAEVLCRQLEREIWNLRAALEHYQLADATKAGVQQEPAMKLDICPNCDTAMPQGCGGAFLRDGESCWLNRTRKLTP